VQQASEFTHAPTTDLLRIEDLTRRELMFSALGAALLIACGDGEDDTDSASQTRTVPHQLGEAQVPLRPRRIVTLWRPTLAAVVLLGFEPVGSVGDEESPGFGLTSYLPDGYPIDEIELVGPQREYDLEKIAGLQPDLIVAALTEAGPERDLYPRLSEIAPTVMVEWAGTTSWRSQLIEVAEALGVRDKAEAVVRDYDSRVEGVRSASSRDPAELEVSLVRVQGPGLLRLETPLSFPGQVIGDVGFARPAAQLRPDEDRDFIEISLERVREAEGDVVFVFHNAGNAPAWEEIRQSPLWQALDAQQAGKVFVFEYEWWGAANYYGAYRILDDIESTLGAI
jgi:iron complex transport system substrate-binding protein